MTRKEGLVHVITGDGNGKTTSAVGIAVRAASRGMRVVFIQFLKGGLSSELPALEKLGVAVVSCTKHCLHQKEHEAMLLEKGHVTFCRDCFAINGMDRVLVTAAFEKAKRMCAGGEYGLVVLDEIFWAMKEGLVSEADVLSLIKSRALGCELILTGRGATRAIEEASDYVTYVKKEKHPFDKGIVSRCGIDY
ncbi:MAG: cob(I)yrinic acid a,c-diamide adenosyltransferase [Candidatus Micrarchaeota archaeon]|nr:cob(I)yrinic acid a,c-diamide adenosyltransferase [Candidatus Micrarchaeota archaeon]